MSGVVLCLLSPLDGRDRALFFFFSFVFCFAIRVDVERWKEDVLDLKMSTVFSRTPVGNLNSDFSTPLSLPGLLLVEISK